MKTWGVDEPLDRFACWDVGAIIDFYHGVCVVCVRGFLSAPNAEAARASSPVAICAEQPVMEELDSTGEYK